MAEQCYPRECLGCEWALTVFQQREAGSRQGRAGDPLKIDAPLLREGAADVKGAGKISNWVMH